jgi:hypothetical protein
MSIETFQIDSYELTSIANIGGTFQSSRVLRMVSASLYHGYYSAATLYGSDAFAAAGTRQAFLEYQPSSTAIISIFAFIDPQALDGFIEAIDINEGPNVFHYDYTGAYAAQPTVLPVTWMEISQSPLFAALRATQTLRVKELIKKLPELKKVEDVLIGHTV